jgi:hypothetical protein
MISVGQAVTGALAGWVGLPPDFDEAALREEIAAHWTAAPELKVRATHSFRVLNGARSEPPASIEAWLLAGEQKVLSIEYRPPDDIDHAAILADLGAPELALAANRYETGAVVRDHVHAARGLTAAIAEPFPDEDGGLGHSRLVYVQLYRAMSTTDYVTTVGQSGEVIRPHPR